MEWHVGDVVRKLREARDWNQDVLAERARLNVITVGRVEAGRETKSLTMRKIAKALGVSVATLYSLVPTATDAESPPRAVVTRDHNDTNEKPRLQ